MPLCHLGCVCETVEVERETHAEAYCSNVIFSLACCQLVLIFVDYRKIAREWKEQNCWNNSGKTKALEIFYVTIVTEKKKLLSLVKLLLGVKLLKTVVYT